MPPIWCPSTVSATSKEQICVKENDELIKVEERLDAAKDKKARKGIEHELFVRANAFGRKYQEFYDRLWAVDGPLGQEVEAAEKQLKALK